MSTSNARIDTKYQAAGAVLVVAGIVLAGLGFATGGGMAELAHSYLYAWCFWGFLTIGCFSMTLLFHITRGRWGTPILRILEAGGGPLALAFAFVALLPVLFLFPHNLYEAWLTPGKDPNVLSKVAYLNYGFWLARQFVYFAFFILVANAFKTWTRKEELTGDKSFSDKRNYWAGLAIVGYFIVLTFQSTDIVMSLDPHFSSTIFGVWFAVISALAATSFTIFTVYLNRDKSPFKERVDDLMRKDFGNLLLMLTMLWAYLSFSQVLIIWSGNLPETTSFYLNRSRGAFNALGFFNIIGSFFLPFLLLLSPSIKRNFSTLGFVAAWIFVLRFFDMHYIVMPFLRDHLVPSAGDIGCLALLGGLWLIQFSMQINKAPLAVDAHPYETFGAGDGAMEAEHA